MRNVTDQPGIDALRLQLDRLLCSYRFCLRADEFRLRIAMLEFEQSLPEGQASKAA